MTRTIDFHYFVVRNGATFCELHAVAGAEPKIMMDDSDSIKMKLSGSFLPPEEDVNWLTDEIRPVMVIDGTEYSLGVFLPSNVAETETGGSQRVMVDAFDRDWIVKDYRMERMLFLQAGTKYLDAIGSVLAESGITLISSVDSDEVLAEDRADWEIGTPALDIVNQLLAEINYEELWFDQQGAAVLEPKATPTANNIEHTLDETNVESLMLPGISRTTDFHNAPNVFICVCSNADKDSAMVAIAENTNPQSPLSLARRGRRIPVLVNVDNIASQEELQLYADRMVTDSMLKSEVIGVTTCLLPGYGVGDIVALRYGETSAICRAKRWTMDLKVGGHMDFTLERVILNLE